MAWLLANWQSIAVGVLAIAEVVALFVPGASGTVASIVKALGSLPGVKDPQIGAK